MCQPRYSPHRLGLVVRQVARSRKAPREAHLRRRRGRLRWAASFVCAALLMRSLPARRARAGGRQNVPRQPARNGKLVRWRFETATVAAFCKTEGSGILIAAGTAAATFDRDRDGYRTAATRRSPAALPLFASVSACSVSSVGAASTRMSPRARPDRNQIGLWKTAARRSFCLCALPARTVTRRCIALFACRA